ncbi:MAG: DUF4465 domain-containing protein [Bacteroidetes bacterium]|nr:DUF4465 domain-containing protein [Bacteroidota bacterium]
MKQTFTKTLALSAMLFAPVITQAQTHPLVSDFENLALQPDTFWNGSDSSGSFKSGMATFYNTYNGDWDMWESGFAYSNMKDDTTAGYGNLYSAITTIGHNGSANYAVAQNGATLSLAGAQLTLNGFYVTNGTYATLSMRDGDGFAKQFGGQTGDDPDWFLLNITGWKNGNPINDTVKFYLADYRFTDNSQDYIVTDWRFVDLAQIAGLEPDSLVFLLTSSDVGTFGMNTPGFFCMDDFMVENPTSVQNHKISPSLNVYPNPAQNFITLAAETAIEKAEIIDFSGRVVMQINSNGQNKITADVSRLPAGVYSIRYQAVGDFGVRKMIKN